jgi:hypothetical protein
MKYINKNKVITFAQNVSKSPQISKQNNVFDYKKFYMYVFIPKFF